MEQRLKENAAEIGQCRSREEAHTELMRRWQSEKEKKNDKINTLTEAMERVNERLETELAERQRMHETMALYNVQIEQKEQTLNTLRTQHETTKSELDRSEKEAKLLAAKLKVSVKEIIRLRQEVADKEEMERTVRCEMEKMEMDKNKEIAALNGDVHLLQNEAVSMRTSFRECFESMNATLNGLHSKLETFSVTIRNLSGSELARSFDTELEARTKSNEVLPQWMDNIRKQLQKTTEHLSIHRISESTDAVDDGDADDDANGQMDGDEGKQQQPPLGRSAVTANAAIRESETQIAHIRMTAMQLLHEYAATLQESNNLYIALHAARVNLNGLYGAKRRHRKSTSAMRAGK